MSVPTEQMPPQGPPQGAPQEMQAQPLSDEDEKDIDIAVARAMEFIQSPPEGAPSGEEVLSNVLSGKNPEQQLAMFFAQMIEAVMMEAQEAGLEINPIIWFAEGGAIDEIAMELEDLMQTDIVSMMPAVKDKRREILSQRGEQLKAQMEGGQQEQPAQPPVDDRPPLLGA